MAEGGAWEGEGHRLHPETTALAEGRGEEAEDDGDLVFMSVDCFAAYDLGCTLSPYNRMYI